MDRGQEQYPGAPKSSYTAALTFLLGEGYSRFDGIDGLSVAELLYETIQDPSTNRAEELLNTVGYAVSEDLVDLLDEIIVEKTGSSEEFIKGVAEIIEDMSAPDPALNEAAIRLAQTLKAWELADPVLSVQETLLNVPSDLLGEWEALLVAADNFFYQMDADKNRLQEITPPTENATYPEGKPNPLWDFINTLDLEDFTGERG